MDSTHVSIGSKRELFLVCKGVLSKARGLMFRSNPLNLLFVFNKSGMYQLHMCFVFFPIDVIFLDEQKRVVEIKEHFRPWSVYTPKNRAMYILEMADGSVKKYRVRLGQKLSWTVS